MKTAIFCDFDGTISKRDVGYSIFHHFSGGKNDELLPDWKAGRMSTRECLLTEAAMVKASPEEIYSFLDSFELDQSFFEFVSHTRQQVIPLFVASDGLDFYIQYLLGRSGLGDLEFTANHAHLENGGITIEFRHQNLSCQRCGICKGEAIVSFKEKQDEPYQVIFIGDGYSDACAAKEADVLFAKKDLAEYCLKNEISFYSYQTFEDISRRLVELGLLDSRVTGIRKE